MTKKKSAGVDEDSAEEVAVVTEKIDHKTAVIDALKFARQACDNAIPSTCCKDGEILGHAIDTLNRLIDGVGKHLQS